VSKWKAASVNPTGSELDAKLRAAGIGRSTFFKRRKAGATVEDALQPPTTTGPGKSEVKPGYETAIKTAMDRGLFDSVDDAPSQLHFSRNIDRGLPADLAILARTRWTPEQIKQLRSEARALTTTPRLFVQLLLTPDFRGYMHALFHFANCLTPEQFYTIALMLVRTIKKRRKINVKSNRVNQP
jgi:hypothetical protein